MNTDNRNNQLDSGGNLEDTTIWKTKTFRANQENFESKTESVEETPDILIVKQKLKKINKRKKYKENVKNIETFENIYQEGLTTTIENFENEGKYNDLFENFSSKKKKRAPPSKVNKPPPAKNNAATNIEEKKGGLTAKDLARHGTRAFNIVNDYVNYAVDYVPKTIDSSLDYFTKTYVVNLSEMDLMNITDLESNKDDIKNGISKPKIIPKKQISHDHKIIKDIVLNILIYPMVFVAMYNWYFVICYRDKKYGILNPDTTSEKDGRPADDKFRIKLDWCFLGAYSKIINYFLDFLILPVNIFDKFVLGEKFLPTLLDFEWKILGKIAMFFVGLFIVYHTSFFINIRNFYRGIPSFLGIFSAMVIIISFVIKTLFYLLTGDEPDDCSKDPPLFGSSMDGFSKIALNLPIGFIKLAIILIHIVIRLVIAIRSISLSSMILLVYIWLHSLFSLFFYTDKELSLQDNIDNIRNYIEKDFEKLKDVDPNARKPDIVKRFMRLLLLFVYKNMGYIGLIGILLTGVSSSRMIISDTVRNAASFMLLASIAFIVILMFANLFMFKDTVKESFVPPPLFKVPENIANPLFKATEPVANPLFGI